MTITPWTLGIPDAAFEQRKPKRGLITKAEIRLLSLARLNLRPHSVVWDIGTATASVAIEAARIAVGGEVWAIEKNEEDVATARRNVERFDLVGRITVVHGRAPDGMENWPQPDAVFVGGSSGRMRPILDLVHSRLQLGGRIVVNVATLENLYEAVTDLKELGYGVEVSLVHIARSKPILNLTRFESFDPVFIIAAGESLGVTGTEDES